MGASSGIALHRFFFPNNNTVDDDTIYQVQDESDPHFISEGQTVELEGVVVTAIDQYGQYTGDVYVQEPDGGPFSGVFCYGPSFVGTTLGDLAVGDRVDVTGKKSEYALSSDTSGRSLTEIINGTITFVEHGTPLQPEVVASPQVVMNDPSAESYEGVLVTVENVRREGVNSYDNVLFSQNFVVGSDFMDCVAATIDDTCYSKVTGVLEYYMNYLVQPRTSDDIEVASDQGACDPTATEICDDGQDNDEDGFTDCDDNDCATDPYCMETTCDDGEDNDENGYTDCDDWGCQRSDFVTVCEGSIYTCSDGIDNDGNGFVDCEDLSCRNCNYGYWSVVCEPCP